MGWRKRCGGFPWDPLTHEPLEPERGALFCDVITDRDLHLVLCNLDILANKPESRYVLARTLDYLHSGTLGSSAGRCASAELEVLLR